VTGRGLSPSGSRIKSIEWGRAANGRCVLFFAGGLGMSHERGLRSPEFPLRRSLWSKECRSKDCIGTERGRRAATGLISGGEQSTLGSARRRLYLRRSSRGGRQASMARMSVGVHRKQLVVYLWTLCQKEESFLVMWTVGVRVSAP